MPLFSLIAALREHIAATVPAAPPVGSEAPAAAAEIPRITVSLEDVVPSIRGLGAFPSAPLTGALRVETTVDLADPVLDLSDEDVALLSPDRRTLQLPHGAVVRASGDDTPPYGTGDLRVRLGGTTFSPVHQTPTATQVQLDIPSGALTFANPLPAAGTLELGYFVGIWDVRVERFKATVHLDMAATSAAALETLSGALETTLVPERLSARGFRTIEPRALSTATPIAGIAGAHRSQRLTYAVEFESIEPVIPSSGGPIRVVAVDMTFDPIVRPPPPVTERFEVT
jgi:hypothetical protein